MLKNLVGSERQVAWAEEIRGKYLKTLDILKEAMAVYADTEQTEIEDYDPLFKTTDIRKVYAKTITTTQEAAIASCQHWHPEVEGKDPEHRRSAWVRRRMEELKGDPHAQRTANVEFLSLVIAALESSIEAEESANYWIDRR